LKVFLVKEEYLFEEKAHAWQRNKLLA